jgi:hypothetical protein
VSHQLQYRRWDRTSIRTNNYQNDKPRFGAYQLTAVKKWILSKKVALLLGKFLEFEKPLAIKSKDNGKGNFITQATLVYQWL